MSASATPMFVSGQKHGALEAVSRVGLLQWNEAYKTSPELGDRAWPAAAGWVKWEIRPSPFRDGTVLTHPGKRPKTRKPSGWLGFSQSRFNFQYSTFHPATNTDLELYIAF
jgi:hypothetical protein